MAFEVTAVEIGQRVESASVERPALSWQAPDLQGGGARYVGQHVRTRPALMPSTCAGPRKRDGRLASHGHRRRVT